MVLRILLSRDLLRQTMHYDAETGAFTWLPRPREMFSTKRGCSIWNARCAGKHAGWTDGDGYLVLCINYAKYAAHRLAWLYVHGEPVPDIIDHADGDPRNNRISNLRAATKAQNNANSRSRGSAGVKGAYRQGNGFFSHIKAGGKKHYLGYFATAEEAAEAYREAAVRLHGEFARFD
jgi:hypothetical protein